MTNLQKWLRTIAWLRREFPVQRPIYVRTAALRDDDGDTNLVKGWFVIKIHRNKSLSIKLDTLLHEWAHCLTWFGADQEEHHSDEWGLWYAKIYRAFHEWGFGEGE